MGHDGLVTVVHRYTSAAIPQQVLEQAHDLVFESFGAGYTDEDWANALGGWHVVVTEGVVVAHAAVVIRILHVGAREVGAGYVESVATRLGHEGRGLGSLALREIATIIEAQAELGALSTGRHSFYERLGWERWQGPTFVRHASGDERTPEEDDGVMVLRTGSSSDIDLAAPITCHDRAGDAW